MYNIFGLRDHGNSNMVVERIMLRNVANFSIGKVHCCYYDEGNLRVIDLEGLKNNRSLETDMHSL